MENRRFKLIMFDMDDTLLKGRTIFVFADKLGFTDKLFSIINSDQQSYKKSIEIAQLLKGKNENDLLELFRTIPLQDHLETVINELKNKDLTTAIATNSYQFVADDLKERLGFDYAFANNLIMNQNIVTGEIQLHNVARERCNNGRIYSICKGRVLERLCETLSITPEKAIAIGDSMVDVGMISKAGLGIAYNASEEVQKHADISTNDFRILLNYI